jgi:hypothetical protein
MRARQDVTHITLRVWSAAAADAQAIEASARAVLMPRQWEIVEVISTTGTPCPIPARDPHALDQCTGYDMAWAVYPASGPNATSPSR